MTTNPFEGRLIRLRAREPEDEPSLHEWFNDPEVTEHLALRYPLSHRTEREFIESVSDVGYARASFAVETHDGRMIGGCGLENPSAENRTAVLGIAIGDKHFWDGGFGTDTMRVLCRFGFEMMNLHRIQLDVYGGNLRAIHVYEKVGFRREATKRQAVYKLGRYHHIHIMGLLEGELKLED
ncbi:MAG: GNAT family N-acetyltransferase [Dehalococcoidia bacterium]|uniref:GNAT family N-acetyltransferase n=1 Tax=Candidatus Amarobacter glycogenicus TaxID=3140699 RepID=UPI003136A0E7|nr:GNAT family N-acetyltransferase [Dehalococcoidia bacterium]